MDKRKGFTTIAAKNYDVLLQDVQLLQQVHPQCITIRKEEGDVFGITYNDISMSENVRLVD